jgi:hypothetical protein
MVDLRSLQQDRQVCVWSGGSQHGQAEPDTSQTTLRQTRNYVHRDSRHAISGVDAVLAAVAAAAVAGLAGLAAKIDPAIE